jgi:hypothetical protein
MEELKHLFAVASGLHGVASGEEHEAAAAEARVAAFRIVDAIRAEPGNATLPTRPIFHYVVNIAFFDLTGPISTVEQRKQVELTVYFPAGRPPARLSKGRQMVVDELRRRPDMHDWEVADRALKHGAWTSDQANDARSRARRITRLRRDAANL